MLGWLQKHMACALILYGVIANVWSYKSANLKDVKISMFSKTISKIEVLNIFIYLSIVSSIFVYNMSLFKCIFLQKVFFFSVVFIDLWD